MGLGKCTAPEPGSHFTISLPATSIGNFRPGMFKPRLHPPVSGASRWGHSHFWRVRFDTAAEQPGATIGSPSSAQVHDLAPEGVSPARPVVGLCWR